MSDLIKEIVTGVLQRNRPAGPADEPAAASVTTPRNSGKAPGPSGYGQPSSAGSLPALPVKRVNYQQERAGKRLAPLAGSNAANAAAAPGYGSAASGSAGAQHSVSSAASSPAVVPYSGWSARPAIAGAPAQPSPPVHGGYAAPGAAAAPPAARLADTRRHGADSLSPLLLRTLPATAGTGGGIPPASGRSTESAVAGSLPDVREPFRLQAGCCTDAWLFPELTGELRQLLGNPGRNHSAAGVISSSRCEPGQLFAAEEILADTPELETDIRWGGDSGFELKLFGSDPQLLFGKLKELTGRLSREDSAASARVYLSAAPSPLLRRHFGSGRQEGIAVVAAGSRWNSIGIVEQWRLRHSAPGLSISVERNYCLLSGSAAELAAAVPQLNAIIAGT
ncbi:hypothetical protein [Paenibacillus tepidiphilus]|uniref:hypothetical protein n=1 Tax=Paenibacillus tepidiphilus TaxID=2608683 RepID=UPI0012386AA0|nr:hypothetical protein [Paenibacillus tepidiphilus]